MIENNTFFYLIFTVLIMCDLLPFELTEKQRQAFITMYAKLVLTRYYKAVLKKTNSFKLFVPDQKTKFDQFLAAITEDLNKIEKDWTFPRCCSEFNIFQTTNKKNDLVFNDFLEEITNTGEGFLSLVPKDDAEIGAARIKQTIIERSGNLPVIEAFRLSVSKHILTEKNSARAMTRLFYFTNQTKEEYEKEIKEANADDKFVEIFLPQLLFTLLVKQNICPHFNLLAAVFTCFSGCTDDAQKDLKANMFLINEWPSMSISEWINQPKKKDKNFKNLQLWKLNRPLLVEIQNVMFQFLFTMYILALCSVTFPTASTLPDDFFRLQKCKRVDGMFVYKTENFTFYVPNLGNSLILCPNTLKDPFVIESGFTSDIDHANIWSVINDVLKAWRENITEWTMISKKTGKDESKGIFSFPLKIDTIHENQYLSFPVPLKTNEKKKIQKWLVKLEDDFRDNVLGASKLEQKDLEKFMIKHFSMYQSVSVNDVHVLDDLTIETYFGLSKTSKKTFKVPLMFVSDDVEFYKKTRYKGLLTDYLQPEKDPKNLIVDAEVETMVNNLTNLTSSGRYKSLMDFITKGVKSFLTKLNDDLRSTISDRHDIEASQLDARKKMRSYGSTFLRLLMQAENDPSPVFKISNLKKWATLVQLRDAFSNNLDLYLQADPKLKELLKSTLQVEDPGDVRNILTTLMFLSFASKPPAKTVPIVGAVAPPTGPSPPAEATTTQEEDEKKMLQLFAELIGENESEIAEMLKYIEGKFGLPNDVRYLLHELVEKITYNMEEDESTHLSEHSFGYQVEAEERQSRQNRPPMENPQETDRATLQKEIIKQTEQLLLLKKQFSILQKEDINLNIKVN